MSNIVTLKDHIHFSQDADSSYATDVTFYGDITIKSKLTIDASIVNEDSVEHTRNTLTNHIYFKMLETLDVNKIDLMKLSLIKDITYADLRNVLCMNGLIYND